MTHKITVRFGGAADSEVHDYSDRIRLLDASGTPAIHGGMQADNGSPGMGELILDDVDNDIPHRTEPPGLQIAAHNQLIWSEDSPGYDAWLSIGRVDNKNVGRPYTYTAGVNRQWMVQWADANIDLDGLTLTADEVRPAETDVNRVLYFLGAFCNGDPRLTTVFGTHLVSSSGTVTMPAKSYEAGTELVEVFDDCASVAGKIYAVVIHEDTGADHTCFLYIDEEDHTTYACTLSISDQLSEVDGEAVFEPHWRQGGATLEQGQELVSGIVSRYGMDTTATAVVLSDVTADAYDYWVKPYNDDLAATATEATARAGAIVRARNKEHVSHQPSILIPARLHNLIRAGMSIDIRSAAAMGGQYLGTTQTRRIAAIEWSHAGWTDEPYLWANLQLDRTPRKLPLSQGTKPGPKPPTPGSAPTVVDSWEATNYNAGNVSILAVDVPGDASGALYVFVLDSASGDANSVTYFPDSTTGTGSQSLTQVDVDVEVDGAHVTAWRLLAPAASHPTNHGRIAASVSEPMGTPLGIGAILLTGVDQTTPETDSATATAAVGTAASITVASSAADLVLAAFGWQKTWPISGATGTPGSGQTLRFTAASDGAFGDPSRILVGSSKAGAASATMTHTTTSSGDYHGWAAIAVSVHGTVGGSPPSLGGPGEGDTTPDGTYLPGGSIIEHGDLSGKGGTMHDATQIEIADAGGYYTGTDQEAVDQEIGAELADHEARIDTLESASPLSNPMTTAADLIVGGSGGTPTRLAKGSDGQVLTVDPTTHLLAWANPSGAADILDIPTAETDTTLVLAPDGAGGVEFRAETGGGGGGLTQAYVGYNTAGGSWDSVAGGKQIMKQVVLANACLITDIECYVQESSTDTFSFSVGIWEDDSGAPKKMLAYDGPRGNAANAAGGGMVAANGGRWVSVAMGRWLAAGTYWIGFYMMVNNTGHFQLAYDSSGSDVSIDTSGFLIDADWASQTNTTRKYSIRANTIR